MPRWNEHQRTVMVAISKQPRTGYDLITATGYPSGTIYPMLARFADAELIKGKTTPSPIGPARTTYSTTAKGRKEMQKWK